MRLYAVADIHAKPERLDRVHSNVRAHAPDILVIAGDIGNYVNPHAVFTALNKLGIPVLAVRGNSDPAWHEKAFARYPNITSLHMKRAAIGGLFFAGISGTIPVPFRSRIRFFEKALLREAAALIDPETILVVHPPPYGSLDRVLGRLNAGSKGASSLMAGTMPRMVLCGHIHEDAGMKQVGNTLVVNCSISKAAGGALIDFDDLRKNGPPVVTLV